MREYMEDAKPFKLKLGGKLYAPFYYLHFNEEVVNVGTLVAYKFNKNIRLGLVTTNFLSGEYCWVSVVDREGDDPVEMEDEIKWTNILCVLRPCK
jgi:hypothetical protein